MEEWEKREKDRVMNSNPINEINHAPRWSIMASMALILVGLLAVIAPAASGLFLSRLLGWVLIFSGIMHFVYGAETHTTAAHTTQPGVNAVTRHSGSGLWETMVGMLFLAIGIYVLARPAGMLMTLALALGIYLLVDAFLEFILSYYFQGMRGSGWLLFHGVIAIVLAVIIFSTWRHSAVWLLAAFVGISIFFGGVARLALARSANHTTRVLPG